RAGRRRERPPRRRRRGASAPPRRDADPRHLLEAPAGGHAVGRVARPGAGRLDADPCNEPVRGAEGPMRMHPAGLPLLVALAVVTVQPASSAESAPATPPLKVGITLHPYYSWVKNVVGDAPVEVRPILPGEVDAGDYQPRPEDIQKIADLDAIVVNGVGHDDFIFDM